MAPAPEMLLCQPDRSSFEVSGRTGTGGRSRGNVEGSRMFVFYSNKFGCLGSILASIVLSGVLILALRSCKG